ncbi:MAG: CoA transferase [Cohaesibacteraceae bacterium]|nr:CoA transferase [Cohaesibacteraceae bacterium]
MTVKPILDGIRILDFTRVMSGPFCTSMLADLGAEIIKIEMPGTGDESRSFGPYKDGESTYFMLLNRNKKSVTIDMKSERGRSVVRDLIPKCDVLVENFRPGVMTRLGLDQKTVASLNPAMIYTSISGFGQEGPLKNWPAFDLVIQAMSGIMSLTGPKNGSPTAIGESMADVCTGMFAAFGIVSALLDRERQGTARSVEVAMLDSLMSMQLTGLARQLYSGDTPKPVGNRHPVTYPVDSFPTLNGDIVMVCFSQSAFSSLCQLMGKPELATDSRFATNDSRNDNEDHLRELITEWTKTLKAEILIELLQSERIPAAPVWDLEKLTTSEHVLQRGLITKGTHKKLGNIPVVPQPVRFSQSSETDPAHVPMLGEFTDVVLKDILNLSEAEISDLHKQNAI